MTQKHRTCRSQRGGALAETLVALLAFMPFVIGIPLLGKQLDMKQKSFDATRYSVWERTVWRSGGGKNVKTADDILAETRDRIIGNARAGLLPADQIRAQGVTENVLWVDRAGQRLLVPENAGDKPLVVTDRYERSPKNVGWLNVPGAAHGNGSVFTPFRATGWKSLGFDENTFVRAEATIHLRDVLGELADRPARLGRQAGVAASRPALAMLGHGGILSDTWSASDEAAFRKSTDQLTIDEGMVAIETPGLALATFGSKGDALLGEGQYGWGRGLGKGPEPGAPSNTVPGAYLSPRRSQ